MRVSQLRRRVERLTKRVELLRQIPRPKREPVPFGLEWMRSNLPHYLKAKPSKMHRDLANDLRDLHRVRGSRENRRAPRGSAKSTWVTKGYGLYCAVEALEKYILILSESGPQAKQFVADIQTELEDNPHLARNYPLAVGKGPTWRADELKLRNGVMVKCKGVGGKIRGTANRADRPSLVIGDDLNGDEDAFSRASRSRKLSWWSKAITSLGDPRTNMIVLGTPIHRDAIVCQLTEGALSAGWRTKAYKSIVRWPDRMDLWGQWEQLRTNLGDPQRTETSDRFLETNRAEMHRGAVVLWDDWEPLELLMKARAAMGPAAFGCEKQDIVGSEGSTEWPTEYFDRPDLWFFDWPECSHVILILDPSKGSGDKPGDYQAHVVIGLGLDGIIYVEGHLCREDSRAMVAHGLDLCREYRPAVWCFEENGTLGLLFSEVQRQLEERAKAGHPQLVNFEAYTSTDIKASRIRHMGGYLARGQIRFRNTPGTRLLVEQSREWPNGDHDDGPDALGTGIRRLESLVNEGV